MVKICLISLGCVKNTVDSEAILGLFNQEDFEFINDPKRSDCIIINTCGFILDAKKEGIDTILEMVKLKKKIIVIGCLVERYYDELKKEIPEVDLYIKFKDEYSSLPKLLQDFFPNLRINPYFDFNNRVISTDKYTFYLKISEGCNNFCSFCSIPYIRGRFISYPIEELINFTKEKVKEGYKEVVVIGQDPTSYGKDLKDKNINLVRLLKELNEIEGLEFIRCLYLYPDGISDELIELFKISNKLPHYFDIPIQHASNEILKLMNRKDKKEDLIELFAKIKKEIPDAILRTTLITGFPGETLKDFNELKEFISKIKFHHLGVFTYSREEGTVAFKLPHQVRESTKIKRRNEIMSLQADISYQLNQSLINKEYKAIIIGIKNNSYLVRCDFNAPDDIDGEVLIEKKNKHNIGDIVKIKITDALVYDLKGIEID